MSVQTSIGLASLAMAALRIILSCPSSDDIVLQTASLASLAYSADSARCPHSIRPFVCQSFQSQGLIP